MNYSMRLNSQLPLHTRKVFAEHHLNSVKLMKDLNGMWQNQRISVAKLAQKYNINPKQISIAYNTWKIFMLGRFKGVKYCEDLLENKEAYRRRFAEINFSRSSFMRVRNNTKLSDKEICLQYGIPSRQAPMIRQYYNISKLIIKEQYQRKMVTEYKNNEIKYGKGIKNSFQIPSVKKKIRQTNLQKYGVTNPHLNDKILAKTIQTLHKKYGKNVNNPFQIPKIKDKLQREVFNKTEGELKHFKMGQEQLQNIDYINKLMKFLYYKNNFHGIPLKALIYHNSYINFYLLKKLYLQERYNSKSLYQFKKYILGGNSSLLEYNFCNLLDEHKIKYRMHVHILPKPYRNFHYDFLLPEYNLLLELNPAYTHMIKDSYKQRFNKGSRNWKFLMAKRQGYLLLNLYSRDFENNFKLAFIKVKQAVFNIKNGNTLYCDNVPYKINQNKIEHLRNYYCYTEGHVWWQ